MFISYKDELYNLALMVKIDRNGPHIHLVEGYQSCGTITCENEEEAKRVMDRIEAIVQPVGIDI